MPRLPPELEALAVDQDGVLSRSQVLAQGLGPGWVRQRARGGHWSVLHPGVYLVHRGAPSFRARVWAGLLHAGPTAAASHRTAAFLHGLLDDEPDLVEVSVVAPHRTTRRPRLRVWRRRHLADLRHPGGSIPLTSVEDTVLDLTEVTASPERVAGWVTSACQRRLTTPARLAAAMRRRSRLRHRRLLGELLGDVRCGVASPLELRYLRDVERAHGLPRGERNALSVVAGSSRYSDVRYSAWRTRVELEGLAYHPEHESHRDHQRDNAAVLTGDAVLRFGWRAVAGRPCRTAVQVAAVLSRHGWQGDARPCSAHCPLTVATTRQI